jgi:hypothetical protein
MAMKSFSAESIVNKHFAQLGNSSNGYRPEIGRRQTQMARKESNGGFAITCRAVEQWHAGDGAFASLQRRA